jgi:hypothetical protein
VNSVEHAWPLWLIESIGGFDSQSATEAQFGAEGEEVSWIGPEVTVGCVCQTCNNGWMSKLEVEAKPVLASLINDLALPLNAPEQSTLSRWSMKTAMVFEATSGKNFYSQDEQQELCSSGALPAETFVWFGRYVQSNILCGEGRHLHENKSSKPTPFRDGYATTLLIRRLVIQVLTLRRKLEFQEIPAKLHIKDGPWDKNLIHIWPIGNRNLKWPPPLSFSNDTIDFPTLSGRFVSKR